MHPVGLRTVAASFFSPLARTDHRPGRSRGWRRTPTAYQFQRRVNDPIWSPDGRAVVFASDVFPECGASDSCNKSISDVRENGPLKVHMADALLYRHWTSWKDGRRSHILLYDVEKKEYRDLTPVTLMLLPSPWGWRIRALPGRQRDMFRLQP